jgi:hypothetical protein
MLLGLYCQRDKRPIRKERAQTNTRNGRLTRPTSANLLLKYFCKDVVRSGRLGNLRLSWGLLQGRADVSRRPFLYTFHSNGAPLNRGSDASGNEFMQV